jgi:hypothetical protein
MPIFQKVFKEFNRVKILYGVFQANLHFMENAFLSLFLVFCTISFKRSIFSDVNQQNYTFLTRINKTRQVMEKQSAGCLNVR